MIVESILQGSEWEFSLLVERKLHLFARLKSLFLLPRRRQHYGKLFTAVVIDARAGNGKALHDKHLHTISCLPFHLFNDCQQQRCPKILFVH